MSRALFLAALKDGLAGMPDRERAEIMADYQAHFADGLAAGRSETDIEASLGDPARLAKELNAESSLKSWEQKRSPKNFLRAGLALMGLATIDFLVLLPLGFVFLVVMAAMIFALCVIVYVGAVLTLAAMHGGIAGPALVFAGLGLVSGAVGGGALVMMLLGWLMRMFGRYGRLHYQILEQKQD